jgi:hypothetical protein
MPNTTNYSFPTPADTDLVKNGADAIRDLGDAVDTAMNTALGTKKAGMVLLNTTSFSAVASQSVNDVFSATYSYYKIHLNMKTSNSPSSTFTFRFRVSGADSSANSYSSHAIGRRDSAITVTIDSDTATSCTLPAISSSRNNSYEFTIVNPQQAIETSFSGTGRTSPASDSTGVATWVFGGLFNATTSFTGFSIIAGAGNLTGSVSVFGVNA